MTDWLGITTRPYQFGEVDYDGHIFRRGGVFVRGRSYEAATVILTHSHADNGLHEWRAEPLEKVACNCAAIAVQCISVVMPATRKCSERFEHRPMAAA